MGLDQEIDNVTTNTSNHILDTSNIISNHILDTSNIISNDILDTSNIIDNHILDTSNIIGNHNLDTSNYTTRIEEELSDRIGYPASLNPFELPSGVYIPIKAQEIEIAEVGRVVGLHTGAIYAIEQDDDDLFHYYKKLFSTLDRGSMRSNPGIKI